MRAQKRHLRSARRLKEKVEHWNAANPIGTQVQYRDDFGRTVDSRTRSPAWVMGEFAVIKLDGRSGAYDFERILPTPRRALTTAKRAGHEHID